MKLNHINLTVTDVGASAAFLSRYFGLRPIDPDSSGRNMVVLRDDDGLVLTLMKAAHNVEVKYPGAFHIGFIQASEEQVNAIHQRLRDDGFEVEPPQRSHAWTFYINAPGGFIVEVLS